MYSVLLIISTILLQFYCDNVHRGLASGGVWEGAREAKSDACVAVRSVRKTNK